MIVKGKDAVEKGGQRAGTALRGLLLVSSTAVVDWTGASADKRSMPLLAHRTRSVSGEALPNSDTMPS